jgi:hypothetical protein
MKIYAYLAMLLTMIGAALGIRRSIVANDRRKAELAKMKAEKETADRIDDVEISDADIAAEFLRERNKHKRDL